MKGFFGGLVGGLALLVALAAMAAGLGAHGGMTSDRLDVITHFAPLILVAAVSAVALAAMGARPLRGATSVIALIGFIAAAALIAPELIRSTGPKAADDGAPRLKLVTFNLWARNSDPSGTAAWIERTDPDVIVMQEAFGASSEVVRRLRKIRPYFIDCGDRLGCSTVILSRWPIVRSDVGYEPTAGIAEIAAPFGRFTVVGVHYTWPYPAGSQQWQTQEIAMRLRKLDPRTTIVAGDFNSTPWSYSLRRQDKLFALPRRDRALATWPAGPVSRHRIETPFPLLPIDHVYAGEGWKTVRISRGPRLGSDHLPLLAELAYAPAG